jgi:hypothetical protein
VLNYGLDNRVFESWQGLGLFLFTTASRPILGPTQPQGAKRPGREADHLSPSRSKLKNACSYTSIAPIRLNGVVLSYSTGTALPLPLLVFFFFFFFWKWKIKDPSDKLVSVLRVYIQKFPDLVDNEININNNKHSLRSNTKGYGGKTH